MVASRSINIPTKVFFKPYYLYIKSRVLAGIYIHIPYCRKACHYCNFHFRTSLRSRDEMILAISRELEIRKNYLQNDVKTIYFGGGTPSVLATAQIGKLIQQIKTTFALEPDAEITLEANPEDINRNKALELKDIGVNRISLGVQSFDDEILTNLNRQHTGRQAINAITTLKEQGFNNMTLDLIYGIPGQHHDTWANNLRQAINLDIPHISSYALTIEEKTAFGHWQKSGKINAVSDTAYNNDYKLMCKLLREAGYEHYEVSNFARFGFKSLHNSSYWQNEAYLGLGPGAHSYNGKTRQFNLSNNARYIKLIKNNKPVFAEEVLSEIQLFNEYLLTGLRTNKGIDLLFIKNRFGIDLANKHNAFIEQCLHEGMATLKGDKFVLTDAALILADSIIIEMMIDET